MSSLHAITNWLISLGIVGPCLIVVLLLFFKCGFPLKHRRLPSFDALLFVLLGVIFAISGIRLILNIRTLNVAGDLYVPIVVGGFASAWAGLHSLINGFNRAISESPILPPKKKDGPDGPQAQDPHSGNEE